MTTFYASTQQKSIFPDIKNRALDGHGSYSEGYGIILWGQAGSTHAKPF